MPEPQYDMLARVKSISQGRGTVLVQNNNLSQHHGHGSLSRQLGKEDSNAAGQNVIIHYDDVDELRMATESW